MSQAIQKKSKIAAAIASFTDAIYEQMELALRDTPAAKSFCLLKFNLPGQGVEEYCYFEGVPIVLMLQGPKSEATGKPDPLLLPGHKSVISLVNNKLSESKGVLGDWGVRLLFNRADRTLQIFAAHLDYASEFLKKEADLAPRATLKPPRFGNPSESSQSSQSSQASEASEISKAPAPVTMTLAEYRAMKAKEALEKSGLPADDAGGKDQGEDLAVKAAIAESLEPWQEQKSKHRKRKNWTSHE